MNTKTAKLVSPERVRDIIECYGSNPEIWPEDEKSSALSVIKHSEELQALLQDAAQFDSLLKAGNLPAYDSDAGDGDAENRALLSKIVNNLPEQEKYPRPEYQNATRQHNRSFLGANRWFGAIAASVAVFAISMSIVELQPVPTTPANTQLAQTVLDEWMWEDVTGETMNEEEEPLTMLALLELE